MPEVGFPVEVVEGVPVVRAPEEIDIANAGGLKAALLEAAGPEAAGPEAAGPGRALVVVDMSRTRFSDSAGLNALVAVARQARAEAARVLRSGGRLAAFWHVFEPPPDVAEACGAVFNRLVPDSPLSSQARPPDRDRIGTGSRRASPPGPPTGYGRQAGLAIQSRGGATGSGLTPGTSGSISWPHPAPSPRSRRTGSPGCWRPSVPLWTGSRRTSRCASRRWRS
jgi:anti-anti-sigma regulatory factor